MVSTDPAEEGAAAADGADAGRPLNREEIVEVLLEAARQVWKQIEIHTFIWFKDTQNSSKCFPYFSILPTTTSWNDSRFTVVCM